MSMSMPGIAPLLTLRPDEAVSWVHGQCSPAVVRLRPRESLPPGAAWDLDTGAERLVVPSTEGAPVCLATNVGSVASAPDGYPWIVSDAEDGVPSDRLKLVDPRGQDPAATVPPGYDDLGCAGGEVLLARDGDREPLRDVVAIATDGRGGLRERTVHRGLRAPHVPLGSLGEAARWIVGVNAADEIVLIAPDTGTVEVVRRGVARIDALDRDARFLVLELAKTSTGPEQAPRRLWDRIEDREIGLASPRAGHLVSCFSPTMHVVPNTTQPGAAGLHTQVVLLPEFETSWWSADQGEALAIARVTTRDGAHLFHTDAGLVRLVAGSRTPELVMPGPMFAAWCSREGSLFRLVRHGDSEGYDDGFRLQRIDPDFRGAVDVIDHPVFEPVQLAGGSWAYLDEVDAYHRGTLHVFDPATGHDRIIATRAGGLWLSEGAMCPASPDEGVGTLAFHTVAPDGGDAQVWLLHADRS